MIADFEKNNSFTQGYKHIKALYQCNGVNLFSGGLILYGLHLAGPFKTAVFPFDIVSHNIDLSHIAKEYDGLIVGGANFEYTTIDYLETRSGELLTINRKSENAVHQWDDFEGFFTFNLIGWMKFLMIVASHHQIMKAECILSINSKMVKLSI